MYTIKTRDGSVLDIGRREFHGWLVLRGLTKKRDSLNEMQKKESDGPYDLYRTTNGYIYAIVD